MSNLSLGILLAPYRVDYYNYLHDELDFEIFFQQRTFEGQMFDSDEVERLCNFTPKYLHRLKLFDRVFIYVGLIGLITREKPKIVISPEFSILTLYLILLKPFISIFSGTKYKVISQCDDSFDMVNGGVEFSILHKISRRFLTPFLDNLLLVDKRALEWYLRKYGKGIWLPIIKDEKRYFANISAIIDMSRTVKSRLELGDELKILFVARLIELKNLPILLNACRNLPIKYKLIVVGDGVMRTKWEEQAEKLGVDAIFVGRKNGVELDAFYYLSDVFVLPSLVEPFGTVTNEALLNGCVCAVSDRAGSSCLIDEGVNGFVFNPESENELVTAIQNAACLANSSVRKNRMNCEFNKIMQAAFAESNH